jgi:hypothetical protein
MTVIDFRMADMEGTRSSVVETGYSLRQQQQRKSTTLREYLPEFGLGDVLI